ncbi:MAG: hypothetical protein AMS27_09925 [Bacteroides sp. SM23_62_1]|nr:MAG: hypothetical protein AMS27_09925 [Bacteroides sp. SM23_62_1]
MKTNIIQCLCCGFLLILANSCNDNQSNGDWISLYNGNNLEGWIQKGGKAQFTSADGMIIGTTVANTENSFLCTEKCYSDFILELEVMVDTSLNSGIQIRSRTYLNGRVHGYQVEIDPSPGGYSGGIYDEARRGWLYYLEEDEKGRMAFKNGEWNKYRIEAVGQSIKTRVNGEMCANLMDDADDSGFIALQVHSVDVERRPWTEGVEVKWRNIRILTENLEEHWTSSENEIPVKESSVTNNLTKAETEEGWKLLFDGHSSTGWKGAHMDAFPDVGWTIDNGVLSVNASDGAEATNGGDIVTVNEHSDFILRLDFRISPGANSGIKYFVTEVEQTSGSAIGLEYQILDDSLHADAAEGINGNRTVASLYDLIPADNGKRVRKPGLWNMAWIVSEDNHVEHWLNGSKVLEYERGSKEFRDLVAISKYKVWKNFGEAESGHILLQDHGNLVSFRNIKILELPD